MISSNLLRVAALVNLPRSAQAGGHVKCWERLAAASVESRLPLDLTVYFSNDAPDEILGQHTILRHLPPLFSTANLKFLPYVPDHTDLSPRHPRLARELSQFDVIHTTDGFFAYARTAERVSRNLGIPLVTSFHTDTPSYTRIFTQQAISELFGRWPSVKKKLIQDWKIPQRQGDAMQRKLERHVRSCSYALVTRYEDHQLSENLIGKNRTHHLRLGVDKVMFGAHRRDREGILKDYGIPPGRIIVLFVGRVDVGKNIYTLIEAMEKLIAEGLPMHLLTAGVGPAMDDVRSRLGTHATVPGFVSPNELARLYASVDVLALASEVEIRSMAGVEAMSSSCPVLVSRKSAVHGLFNHTPAMEEVSSGALNWTNALRAFASDPERQSNMRVAASDYSLHHLASWQDVLAEDLFAIWKLAAEEKQSRAD